MAVCYWSGGSTSLSSASGDVTGECVGPRTAVHVLELVFGHHSHAGHLASPMTTTLKIMFFHRLFPIFLVQRITWPQSLRTRGKA